MQNQTAITQATGSPLPSSTPAVLGWTFFVLTFVALGYQIAYSHRQLVKMAKDEIDQKNKIAELEMNLREIRGDEYTAITEKSET